MNRKIIILTNIYYPRLESTGYYITKIAEKLLLDGEEVVIVTSKVKEERKLDRKEHIIRIGLEQEFKNILILRIFGMFLFLASAIRTLRSIKNKEDRILIVSNPPLLVLTSIFFKSKGSFTLLLHDFFPFNYFLIQDSRILKLLNPVIEKIFKIAYFNYNQIIVVGEDMNKRLTNFVRNNKEHKPIIVTVPNWSQKSEILAKWESPTNNQYKIVFAGNIGLYQSLERFTDIFIKCRTKYTLTIYGIGIKLSEINKKILQHEAKNIELRGEYPRSEQSNILGSIDIGLITLREGMYGLGVPSKFYNLLAAGKPILYIGDEESELFKLITNNNLGWAFNWQDDFNIQEFLELELPIETILEKGKNSRSYAAKFEQGKILTEISRLIRK